MSQVKIKENESLENALRRFKRQTARDGVIQEVRKREHYEKPSVKRKKKSAAARKRTYQYFFKVKAVLLSTAFSVFMSNTAEMALTIFAGFVMMKKKEEKS